LPKPTIKNFFIRSVLSIGFWDVNKLVNHFML
jgi:hypothetical protein